MVLSGETAVRVSALFWYEYCRGPRTPAQLAVAETLLGDGGVLPIDATVAARAADLFRTMGSPRRRAADVLVAASAIVDGAVLWTCNVADFSNVPGLRVGP